MKNLLIFTKSDQTRPEQWVHQPDNPSKLLFTPKHRYEKGNLTTFITLPVKHFPPKTKQMLLWKEQSIMGILLLLAFRAEHPLKAFILPIPFYCTCAVFIFCTAQRPLIMRKNKRMIMVEFIPGATIMRKEQVKQGAISDNNGNYSIRVSAAIPYWWSQQQALLPQKFCRRKGTA